MKINTTSIAGVFVVDTSPVSDHRGAFARFFCMEELSSVLGSRRVVQINHSRTSACGAIRGMHFQHPPHAEMKMVRCLKGRVFDVVVDLRRDSPTFMQHHAEELDPQNAKMLIIPEGCAHGFQALAPESELLYLHTAFYEKSAEGGLRHDDPVLKIKWPLPVTDLSERDKNHPLTTPDFKGINI